MEKDKKKGAGPRLKKKSSSDNGLDNNIFCRVILAARRAKELIMGEKPLIDSQTVHPCLLAIEEIKRGKIKCREKK